MFSKDDVNYSLYLVTDSTMLPEGKTLEYQVEKALQNGVTLVQLREKDTDTKTFLKRAQNLKDLCTRYGVPLIINDRVDIALAVDADGVHVGQDDMPVPVLRRLLGPDKIIGLSVGYPEEVEELAKWGEGFVDYIGIGMVFPTLTKKNPKKSPMGTVGVSRILSALEDHKAAYCRSVAIGGLHPDNIPRVLIQSMSSNGCRSVDGIAVVSEIMQDPDAGQATRRLKDLINLRHFKYTPGVFAESTFNPNDIDEYIKFIRTAPPLVHHITNDVHQNFGANITLALGASPIMSKNKEEFEELAKINQSVLLLNTGSLPDTSIVFEAVRAYNEQQRPIIYDPVGYSATSVRLMYNQRVLTSAQFTCIKGNAGEILSMDEKSSGQMRGVDSTVTEEGNVETLVEAARRVAYRYRTIVVMTGENDIVIDGTIGCTFNLSTGAGITSSSLPAYVVTAGNIPIMGSVTTTGCSLGTAIACFVGSLQDTHSVFSAVLSAVIVYKVAGKVASERCSGSGSFQKEFLDALYQLARGSDIPLPLISVTRM
ncbi:HER102Wp [Eremothecium sinecaudum]|uniref:HER102Wp n=1 Tax=Eremothecium sinecaudum TaxID=45286 RepID=A0A0X8HTX7_9SACH|nr:HER102Wp [Eremothecium sinecaudum]AMD21381.1 HER102Wp [Eremothecium sinecaudum]